MHSINSVHDNANNPNTDLVREAVHSIYGKDPVRRKGGKKFSAAVRLGAGALFLVHTASAADPAATTAAVSQPVKPAWLADLSVSLKESYDDNVFLSDANNRYYAPNFAVPNGSVAALKDIHSWVTTVSPRMAVNFAPLLGDQKFLKTFSLGYAPDFVFYHGQTSEDYDAQRFVAAVKGGADAFSFSIDDKFSYIDGSKFGPTYPGGFVTAYNTAVARERREQIQDQATVCLRYDLGRWFVRPTASILYYDLMTEQLNVTGYQNYPDRYDVNGGSDVGYQMTPHLAATLGYRYGRQYQQQFSFSKYSASGDYQRVLAGFEGKPWSWLDVKFQAGPDFRDYDPNTQSHTAPVDNRYMITYYGEACVVATVTPKDTVTFKYKQWQWVSSVGKVPYFDSTYDLSYHRKLTEKLGLDLGGRILDADYTSANVIPSCVRNDSQYTVSAGLGYAINTHASLNLAYSLDVGANAKSEVLDPDTRDYHRQLISLAAQFKF